MDKPKFESPNLTAANIEKIAGLFPGVVTEGKVNFDLLRSLLGDDVYGDEAYEFTWVGKRAAIAEAGRPIRKTLRPCPEESKNWDTTENLYIEGDNLDVLKLLQESYLGKVKMIYIDPPYNTGNDFVYRDNFKRDKDEYEEEAGVYDEDGDRLFRNTESNGRFHSDWCSMMYPRLVLARNILRDDGVIFISIDDKEVDNLKKICSEVFGSDNFVAQFIWKSKLGKVGTTSTISATHEYILCFGKQIEKLSLKMIETQNEGRKENLRQWGQADRREDRPSMYYPIAIDGVEVLPIKEDGSDGRWRVGKEMAIDLLSKGQLQLSQKNGKYDIYRIFEPGVSIIPYDTLLLDEVGTTAQGATALKKLELAKVFDYSKPVKLLYFFSILCTSANDIILDFFSGSATTAHAVMQLNSEDGGKRKFIMVQLPEPCAPDSEAAKAGYKNICEIGKERIRRAGEKIVCRDEEAGGSQKEEYHECSELQRLNCLAKINSVDKGNIPIGQTSAKGGNICPVRPDAEGGGFDSLEHSGGTLPQLDQRISQLSFDGEGFKIGVGDTDNHLHGTELSQSAGMPIGNDIAGRNQQNDNCPYAKTQNCPLISAPSPLDIGFRVFKLDDTNMKDVYYAAGEYTQDLLAGMEDNIKEDRTDMDLLYACLLDWGLPLSLPHKTEVLNANGEIIANSELRIPNSALQSNSELRIPNSSLHANSELRIPNSELFTVHTYNSGDLIACFDKYISDAVVKAIASRQPLRAVFRDSSFTSSPEKINVEEIFKLLAPNTSVKVL